jgi:DNA-binding GntR family transcriptional regulator
VSTLLPVSSLSRKPLRHHTVGGNPADVPPAETFEPDALGEDTLHETITRALLEGKLRPGTPLRERYLAEAFGVTRGMVRKVLLRLGQEGKLDMHANRGAFVPEPSAQQIRHVYQARKAVEAGILSLLATSITPAQLQCLRAHVRHEHLASRRERRDESIQLAGDFHVVLAGLLNNPELDNTVRQLVSRTQMFVALFEPAQDSHCAADEHGPVIDALAKGNAQSAVDAMVKHLSSVEQRVIEQLDVNEPAPLADILRSMLQGRP